MENLKFIRETSWQQVLDEWRNREAGMGWEAVYEPRGFKTWDEWRAKHYSALGLPTRSWRQYQVDHSEAVIPGMWAVAYSGWRRYYPAGLTQARFADIVKHPDLPDNGKVKVLLENFPLETTVIAVKCGDDLALFEGMHRAATIALLASRGQAVKTKLIVALTEFDGSERDLFEKAITQKSESNDRGE
jgi:hypothetical protein